MARLQDKVAFITGASSGIGAACAKRFVEEGAVVVGYDLADVGSEDWQAAVAMEPRCALIVGDVLDDTAVSAAIEHTATGHGRLDILVNSAGTGSGMPVHMMPVEEFDRVMDINLKGTFIACHHALPIMMRQRSGSIINLASMEGIIAGESIGAYNASKAAVILLSKNMAIDYGRLNIRVNALCPGFIESPMTDAIEDAGLRERLSKGHMLDRMGLPVEVAHAALFLASDEASFVTGSAMLVDGGYTAGKRSGINEMFDFGLS